MLTCMGRIARVVLTYGVVASEYLLAGGALYAAVWLLASAPPPNSRCVDSCIGDGPFLLVVLICGGLVLGAGLPAGLIVLAVRLQRLRRGYRQQQSDWALVGFASRAARRGLLWGVAALPVLGCGGLGLFKLMA